MRRVCFRVNCVVCLVLIRLVGGGDDGVLCFGVEAWVLDSDGGHG